LKLTLVLLPGMDGTGQLFDPFVTALKDEFEVSVVRYPNDEPLGYGELTSIARAALPRQGSFVLVGESFSGPIAISIAASRPSGLVGLVLACTFARNPRPQLAFLKYLIGLLPASRVPTVCMSYLLLGRFSNERLRSLMMKAVGMVSDKVFDARLRAVLNEDVTDQLTQIDVPLLYLQATEDKLVPTSAERLISASCPHARTVPLCAPHFLLQTVPDAAAKVIKGFVRAL
jgi:pimeloyl-ACP methyl ester carboxylesterase